MGVETIRCDNLVIGSGPGGATTACLLAEAGYDVVMVEEGKNLTIKSAPSYSLEEMSQKYRNSGLTPAFGKTRITYIEGRCVGGASEINAALYHRPLPQTLKEWQLRYQIDDFGPDTLTPFFEDIEKELSVSTRPGGLGPASKILGKGAKKMGWKTHEVKRFWKFEKGSKGTGGVRQSMSETMVPRALAAGCRLHAQTRIKKLILKGSKAVAAVGIHTDDHGKRTRVRFDFDRVFVCTGAVQTPTLLHRSRITEGIGNSLRMHPMARIAVNFDRPANNPSWGVPSLQIEEFKPHLTLGCSHSSLPHIALWLTGQAQGKREKLAEWSNMGVYYAAITGSGIGSVRNIPVIDEPFVRFPLHNQDLALLGEGLYKLGLALFEAGAKEVFNPIEGGPTITSPDGLDAIRLGIPQGRVNVTTIHLFSSCPMGEDERQCPVDSWGKLRHVENVYINDASILPNTPGVNPQGTVMAVARRNLAHFLAEA